MVVKSVGLNLFSLLGSYSSSSVDGVHRVLVGKPEGKKHWGDPDADGRIILRWIFRILYVGLRIGC